MATFLGDGKQKNSIPVLDGVRAIACLSIITFHMNLLARFYGIWNPSLDGVGAFMSAAALSGESGVILFFVLSGFLLFLPYAKSMLFDSDWPSLRRFYVRRVFRIIPGYYVALCLMTLFLAPEYLQQAHWHDLWLFLTFRMDFPSTFQQLNAPFWTLALEFQFYMVLPLIAWVMGLVVRRGPLSWRLAKLTFCLLLALAWGLGTRYWGAFLSATPTLDFLIPHSVSDALRPYIYGTDGKFFETFVIGMLVCMVYTYVQHERLQRNMRYVSLLLFAIGSMVLGFMALWHFYRLYVHETLQFFTAYEPFLATYWDLVYPICYAIGYGLCMLALLHGAAWLKRPFEWTPLRWLGLISYSLYMWHYPIIWHFLLYFLPKFQGLGWSQTAQSGVYWLWLLLTAFPISIILYRFVEMPGIRLGEQLCQRWLGQKTRQDLLIVQIAGALPRVIIQDRMRQLNNADWIRHIVSRPRRVIMNDELSEPLQMELFAASLRADYTDVKAFLEALAVKLEGSLPNYTTVTRHSSLFSREHPVKEITVSLGEYQYRIGKERQGPLVAQRAKVVRGIVLKTEQIPVEQWIEELAQALAQLATHSAQARAALERFLI